MKKTLVCLLTVAILGLCGSAMAQGKVWDDLSWWGQSGATPAPVKDTVRSGYWWWPTEPASNADDAELWGNRGVVYNANYTAGPPEKAPEVPPGTPPKVGREIPTLDHVLFDFDKAVLKPEGKAAATKVVDSLKQYPKDTVVVEGHTCNVGAEDYNMTLGQRRADAVKKFLVESGITEPRVTTKSYGESQPAVPNDTPANRKLNRRVVFNITVVD